MFVVVQLFDRASPLAYVGHVSKVVLEILDEVIQSGGGLVKAPDKQSPFLR